VRMNDGRIVGRGIAIAGIADRGTHRGSTALTAVSMLGLNSRTIIPGSFVSLAPWDAPSRAGE
jgi:hypothetical protein